jgi:hypothetical protein
MKASEVSFRRMMLFAATSRRLAEPTSFIQVEYGIEELMACWDGFRDTSDQANLNFQNTNHVCDDFTTALIEFISFLKPESNSPGFATATP